MEIPCQEELVYTLLAPYIINNHSFFPVSGLVFVTYRHRRSFCQIKEGDLWEPAISRPMGYFAEKRLQTPATSAKYF
jgi:hypothetical protein